MLIFSFVAEAPIPINVILSINHSVFVKGDHTNFEIEPSFGVEASELYPDVKYTTVEEILGQFAWELKQESRLEFYLCLLLLVAAILLCKTVD